jgi:prophage maintenance system killer protein
MYVMLTFLEVNGIRLQCTDEEIVHAGLSLAEGSMGYDELLAWIREHVMPQEMWQRPKHHLLIKKQMEKSK